MIIIRKFGKTAEYALLALMHLAQTPSGKASAREIAQAFRLPWSLVCKTLKCLHQKGLLDSERGVHGGYRIAVDLSTGSIERLLKMFRRAELGDRPSRTTHDGQRARGEFLPTEPSLLALHRKLEGFLTGHRVIGRRHPRATHRRSGGVHRNAEKVKGSRFSTVI